MKGMSYGRFDLTMVVSFSSCTSLCPWITGPADETIVYAISSTGGKLKGTLVTALGAYADTPSEELVRKLNIKRKSVKF